MLLKIIIKLTDISFSGMSRGSRWQHFLVRVLTTAYRLSFFLNIYLYQIYTFVQFVISIVHLNENKACIYLETLIFFYLYGLLG